MLAQPYVQCPSGTFSYAVQPGDTFNSIAVRFNTTIDAIARANPTADSYSLRIGQQLCIPRSPATPACVGIYYTVRPGDNFYNLALRFNTTVNAIAIANPTANSYNLFVGQKLCIPRRPIAPPCAGVYYRVRAGDNMYAIAQRNGILLQDLLRANPGVNPYQLYIGQVLCIPQATLPATKTIPVTVEGQTEYRPATLNRSAQGYAIYVLPNFRFAGEEPGKDLLTLAIDNRYFTRIEKLPPNSDIAALRANALADLRTTAAPTELKGTQIFDPFFRQAIFFLTASTPALTRDIIVMRIGSSLFRFTMNIPTGEPTEGAVPGFFAMLKTIIPL